jgi:UDP-glucose 4-epimerase
LARGHGVRALVRPATDVGGLWGNDVEVVRADLRSPQPLELAFDGVNALVHLAADITGTDEEQFEATVIGTERLLGAMARTGTKRLVLASSITVYDWGAAHSLLDESTPMATDLEARGGYTVAKVWQERVARRMSTVHDFEITVLRPGFIWGRDQERLSGMGQKVGPLFIIVAATRLPLTYIENCADLFVTATEEPAALGETFNVVDDDAVRAWRYTGEYLRRTGTAGTRIPVPYWISLGSVHVTQWTARSIFGPSAKLPSILVPARFEARFKPLRFPSDKLRLLNWRPPYSFDNALDRTYGETLTNSADGGEQGD